MASPGLELKLGQQLALTPQLRQALKLLQMSTLELRQTTLSALESNVMLEVDEGEQLAASDARATDTDEQPIDFNDESGAQVDTDWDIADIWEGGSNGSSAPPGELFEPSAAEDESLREHLLWQVELVRFSEADAMIALALIDSIDERGYLNESLEQISRVLPRELEAGRAEITAVLHRIQTLDPVGIGARNLKECLQIQLHHLDSKTPGLALAKMLVKDYLELLTGSDLGRLKDELEVSRTALQTAIELVQSLNPTPGLAFGSRRIDYIVPDVLVSRQDGRWLIELNPEVAPRLRVNALYADCLDREGRNTSTQGLRRDLQEARWFVRSVKMRNDTLLRVARALVAHQQEFLINGEEAMRPLVLNDIATRLEMHESTISRVTTQKYMYTPRGIFEFKYFFSAQVGAGDGEEHSATAIRAMIRKLIATENRRRPLSDGKITAALHEQGIKVARRTTAKYRESMAIPASHERKR